MLQRRQRGQRLQALRAQVIVLQRQSAQRWEAADRFWERAQVVARRVEALQARQPRPLRVLAKDVPRRHKVKADVELAQREEAACVQARQRGDAVAGQVQAQQLGQVPQRREVCNAVVVEMQRLQRRKELDVLLHDLNDAFAAQANLLRAACVARSALNERANHGRQLVTGEHTENWQGAGTRVPRASLTMQREPRGVPSRSPIQFQGLPGTPRRALGYPRRRREP